MPEETTRRRQAASPPVSPGVLARGNLSFFAILFLAPPALAQGPVQEIIVTGRGLGEARGDAVYGAVEIDRDALIDAPSGRLEEVLRDVPGFQLFRRSDARSANPTSQGATLRGLGGNASSRALIVLDGVPQSDPFGGWVYWPSLDPTRLASARVVRGGGSGVNGPGALAGTIELESASAAQTGPLDAEVAYGSRDSMDARAAVGAALGAGFLTTSASYARGEGFAPVVAGQRGPIDRASPYEQTSFALRAVAPVGSTIELQAGMLLFRDERERGTPFTKNVTNGADASLRLVGNGALPFALLGYVQLRDYYNSFASVNADRSAATQASEQYSVPATGIGARAELRPTIGAVQLRFGGDWREAEGETRELYSFVAARPTRAREAGGRNRTVGGFVEAGYDAGPLTISGGARIDRWWIEDGFLDERVIATGDPLTDADFAARAGWEPTGRAGVAWRLSDTISLRAAGYLGWRLPTLNELYRPFRVGPDATAANAALAPERLRGIEAGIEVTPAPGARIALTAFANRLENAIANITLGAGPGTFPGVGFVGAGGTYSRRDNLDAVESRGVEIDGSLALGSFDLVGGYSLVDAQVVASGPALPLGGLRPAQTPRHSASARAAWKSDAGARVMLGLRYIGAQFEDDLNLQHIPSALTFDASASLPIGRGFRLELRGENLADELVVAGISGAGIVERATPRTIWFGLGWSG